MLLWAGGCQLSENHDVHQEAHQLLQQVVLHGWRHDIADYLLQSVVNSQSMPEMSLRRPVQPAHQQQADVALEKDISTSVSLSHSTYANRLLRQHLICKLCRMMSSGMVPLMSKSDVT